MATLGNKKAFSGMVGNLVFRYRDGKQIVQSHPGSIKQTLATKKSASEFGSCSRWAKHLRDSLHPLLVKHTDSAMHQRFTTAVYNAIKLNTSTPQGARTPLNSNMESLHGYEFNTHSLFANYFKAVIIPQLNSGNELTITLPAFDPKTDVVFPNGCTSAKLAVYVIATDFGDTTTPQVFHTLLPINKNSLVPAQTLLTTPVLPAGHLVLVVAKLLYYTPNPLTESNYLNTKDFSPAMVVLAETVPE